MRESYCIECDKRKWEKDMADDLTCKKCDERINEERKQRKMWEFFE